MHKVSINELLSFIPEDFLSHLSTTAKVDYYSKDLHCKKMLYLLCAILDNKERVGYFIFANGIRFILTS